MPRYLCVYIMVMRYIPDLQISTLQRYPERISRILKGLTNSSSSKIISAGRLSELYITNPIPACPFFFYFRNSFTFKLAINHKVFRASLRFVSSVQLELIVSYAEFLDFFHLSINLSNTITNRIKVQTCPELELPEHMQNNKEETVTCFSVI